MKKILAGLGVLICAVLVITGAKAYVVSYTLYVAKGSTETTNSFYADYNQNYAVVNYMSVENGDTFDMYLQALQGTNGYTDISNKTTINAPAVTGKLVAYRAKDGGTPGADEILKCNSDTFATSSTQCVIQGNDYRMKFHNGSWFGGTVAITGLFYGSDR